MIVFDLKCDGAGHVFEAWFGSSEDYADQQARALLSCPICGDMSVSKAVMAPAVAPKGNRGGAVSGKAKGDASDGTPVITGEHAVRMRAMMEALAQTQSKMLEGSNWVGRAFAEQARAMHYGEQDHAPIHGEVAPDEASALLSEGVAVTPLPFPVIPPEAKN
ncbi:MAG: DUF1178 family protein [Sphingobium sp.]